MTKVRKLLMEIERKQISYYEMVKYSATLLLVVIW